MPADQEHSRTLPQPRALRTIKGARLELARLYIQVKNGEIDPFVAGRLVNILGLLLSSARDHALDERMTEIEARLALVKTNGHARPEARP
jgi:hypothetical protein